MAITLADFSKIWASTSPLTPYSFSDANYQKGWNFVGATPPSRQMWDFLQKNNDEKMQYLANNYLPLSGGTMTGNVTWNMKDARLRRSNENGSVSLYGGTGWSTGPSLALYGSGNSNIPGCFDLSAHDGTTRKQLIGKPDGTLTWGGQPLLPVGVVQAFAGSTTPAGWLLCDGSAVSRTTYAALFSVIGTTYGAGNGSTTFNLPNLTNRFIQGNGTVGTVKNAGLPNITGKIESVSYLSKGAPGTPTLSGAFKNISASSNEWAGNTQYDGNAYFGFEFDASHSNSIYGNSTTVQPPALTMRYIIKY